MPRPAREAEITRRPQPEGTQAPVVSRVRIRYAKRGPLRFTSHRDFARAFERALRRAGVPVAYSQGFTPHPKISYASAAPTGMASEAEYLELGLREHVDPQALRAALDAALAPGLDVLAVVTVPDGPSLAGWIEVSRWMVELPGVAADRLRAATEAFCAAGEIVVERLTKQGRRRFDVRAAVVSLQVADLDRAPAAGQPGWCAILEAVIRQVTPSVRPDDVLAGLSVVAELVPPEPPRVTRLAQGRLSADGEVLDPLHAEGDTHIGAPSESRELASRPLF